MRGTLAMRPYHARSARITPASRPRNLTKNLVVLVVETLALMMLAMVGLMDLEKMATVVV